MKRDENSSRRGLTPLLALLCLATTVALYISRSWVHLGVPHFHPQLQPFSDTQAQLVTAAACRMGLGTWHGSACFVPDAVTVPRAQTYQPWLAFHDLGLLPYQHATIVAWVMIVLFFLVFARLCAPANIRELLLALAIALTAGVQLCVERGNFDLLMFVLLAGAALSLAKTGRAAFVLGTGLLAFATSLKLYTGAATALSWLAARGWRWKDITISAVFVALAVAVVGPSELIALGHEAPEGQTRFSTGVPWLVQYLGIATTLVVLIASMALVAALLWRRHSVLRDAIARIPRSNSIGLHLAALTAVPLFAMKASYDYRFVIWLPAILAMLKLSSQQGGRWVGYLGVALFVLAAGMELPLHWIEPWQHTVIAFDRIGVVQVLLLIKQGCSVALAALIAGLSVLGLSMRAPGDAARQPGSLPLR